MTKRTFIEIDPADIGDECLPNCPICNQPGEMGAPGDEWYSCGHFVTLITTATDDGTEPSPEQAPYVIVIEHDDGFREKLFFRGVALQPSQIVSRWPLLELVTVPFPAFFLGIDPALSGDCTTVQVINLEQMPLFPEDTAFLPYLGRIEPLPSDEDTQIARPTDQPPLPGFGD